MQQVVLPITAAVGLISRHNISDAQGRKIVAKGRTLHPDDVALLAAQGITEITVVQLDADDIDEHTAALRIAEQCAGLHTRVSPPHHGRADITATIDGVLMVDTHALQQWHHIDGVTIATRPSYGVVHAHQRVATIKILPFAVPATAIMRHDIAHVLRITPFVRTKIGVIVIGASATHARLQQSHVPPLNARINALHAQVTQIRFVTPEIDVVRAAFEALRPAVDMIITLGETSIMDRDDVMPQALLASGGRITCYGAPVEPGNLLLLGTIGSTPVIGAPGCVRSMAPNVIDLLLPRMIAGIPVDANDVYALAHGGLLEESS